MDNLSEKEQDYLKGYAQALQDLMLRMTGDNGCSKIYDPIEFEDGIIHSYAFDFKDGGRRHPLKDYKSIDEIEEYMLKEASQWLRDFIIRTYG